MKPFPPQLRARYQPVRLLYADETAHYVLAMQMSLQHPVTVKLLADEARGDRVWQARFAAEARITASFSHPNILRVIDLDMEEENAYMVLESMDGPPLAARLKHDPMAPAEVLQVALQMAEALQMVHVRGIVHRDVCPANIWPTDSSFYKLSGFTMARLEATDASRTNAGILIGRPPYISPEQLDGEPATPASDIYALGATLFELLIGHPPFAGDTALAVLDQHRLAEPRPPSSLRTGIPPIVDRLLLKMLEKDPARRFSSAQETAAAVASILGSAAR